MGTYVTESFLQREASLFAGESIKISHICLGDGEWAVGEYPQDLVHEVMEIAVKSVKPLATDPTVVKVVAVAPVSLAGQTVRELKVKTADGLVVAMAAYGEVMFPENLTDIIWDQKIEVYIKTKKAGSLSIVVSDDCCEQVAHLITVGAGLTFDASNHGLLLQAVNKLIDDRLSGVVSGSGLAGCSSVTVDESGYLICVNYDSGTGVGGAAGIITLSADGNLNYESEQNYPPLEGVVFSINEGDILATGEPTPEHVRINNAGQIEVIE